MNGLPDRAFGRLQVDDHAAFQSCGALMANAEYTRDMGPTTKQLDLIDRFQFRDDADHLAGSDVENRQDGALACGERLQARCQTLT